MRKSIDFVRGAIAKKDIIPVLTHLHFYAGRVQAGNGQLFIDSPCDIKSDFTVPTKDFLAAIDSCIGEPVIASDSSKIVVSEGKFKVTLPKATGYPVQAPEGDKQAFVGDLLSALKALNPFIGEDASRPWCCGMLFRNNAMYATNNIVAVSVPFTSDFNNITFPNTAIDEIIRIGINPVAYSTSKDRVTLYYEGDQWIKFSLLYGEWPTVEKFMPDALDEPLEVTDALRKDCERIGRFCPDARVPVIKLSATGIETMAGDKSATCTEYDLPEGYYRIEALIPVLSAAKHIDLTKYPKPCPFIGDKIKGVLIGCRP